MLARGGVDALQLAVRHKERFDRALAWGLVAIGTFTMYGYSGVSYDRLLALTLMMVPGRGHERDPADINRLLDAAFTSLSEMGNDVYASFVRDQIGFRDFVTFMRKTARRRPTSSPAPSPTPTPCG